VAFFSRFLLGADAVASGLVLLSLIGVCVFLQNKPNRNHWFALFLHDLVSLNFFHFITYSLIFTQVIVN